MRAFAARLPAPVAPPEVGEGRIDLIAPGAPLGAAGEGPRRATCGRWTRRSTFWVGGQTAEFVDQQASLRRPPADRAGDPVHDDAADPVRDAAVGRAADQGAGHEPADAERGVRAARARVPGRAPRLAVPLRLAGGDRVLPARAAVRGGVRAVHRLRRVPARTHQGAARRRALQRGGGRARAAADGADRHVRGGADGDRDRLLRDGPDHLHQAARVRRGGGRADRRDDRPGAARARADAPARAIGTGGFRVRSPDCLPA